MSRDVWVLNPGWVGQLLRTPTPRLALYQLARVVQQNILGSIPVHYGTSQQIFEETSKLYRVTSHGFPQVRITTGDPFWHFLEYGTVNNPPYRPFQRGAEASGLSWQTRPA